MLPSACTKIREGAEHYANKGKNAVSFDNMIAKIQHEVPHNIDTGERLPPWSNGRKEVSILMEMHNNT